MSTHTRRQSGFAMLFTVLIVGLILSIAISISNLTLKQAILSNLAKDSQIAFYQADAAVECGMYQDSVMGAFPRGATTGPLRFYCGSTPMVLDQQQPDYFKYVVETLVENQPCFSVTFNKTDPTISKVQGSGFNVCGESPRRVERALEVKY